ncbi:AbrB family transcriptional regulator [Desulfovibrio sp. OttesenSCG-928-I05]|nr:AbrB family transcriptional regulator [Desulfovibrio sp. OttesenSCG-928-I05]
MTRSSFSAGFKRRHGLYWIILLGLTLFFIAILELLHLPASPMLGGIIAGCFLSMRDAGLQVPTPFFLLGQSLIGLMISQSFSLPVLHGMLDNWFLALMIVLSALLFALAAGMFITVRQYLPGTTGIWGTSPGAATAMTLMSEAYGADMRLVAVMQYLRVMVVSILAAVVAGFLGAEGAPVARSFWDYLFPPVDWEGTGYALLVTLGCAWLGHVSRFQAGPFIIPMFVGTILLNTGIIPIALPGWLLTIGFALIGWSIGLRFNRAVFLYAWRALPKILGAIFFMVATSGLVSLLLVLFAGIDPLTAYLATSPGGVDAVAIIAVSSGADMVFIMAIQTARLFLVIISGPPLARVATGFIRKRMHTKNETQDSPGEKSDEKNGETSEDKPDE